MNELVEELLRLQIRQTEILGRLLHTNAAEGNVSTTTEPLVIPPDGDTNDTVDRPFQVGDQVRVLNPGRIFFRRDTIFTIVKIGARITSVSPSGLKIVRSAQFLERV
jgi:hypothetical protein